MRLFKHPTQGSTHKVPEVADSVPLEQEKQMYKKYGFSIGRIVNASPKILNGFICEFCCVIGVKQCLSKMSGLQIL
ncbi:hypothetical protein PHMEG_000859 [Phytophthora megakarya]|uniref:Uncharacterized protein n=1 Tax=Phytophthora megakarya TaxID=4795 RepID=A0A225X324_9STRA|nr:hypothetical protein PHMEG_000859 [Phytophthora megakarya]